MSLRWLAWVALLAAAGCKGGATSLLLEVEGPATVTGLSLTVSLLEGDSHTWSLPDDGSPTVTLPARVVVLLPEVLAMVEVALTATGPAGTVTASTTVTSKLHRQVVVPLTLAAPGSADLWLPGDADPEPVDLRATDATDTGPADLAAGDLGPRDLATVPGSDLTNAGDLKPVPGAPVPRVLANAYFTNYFGTTFESPVGMSQLGYEIPTAGVVNGELLLFIATIDNNGSNVWPDPFAPGFAQLAQVEYGVDGQNYVVAWKIANNEPAIYSGSYVTNNGSGSTSATLLAVSGAHASAPINVFLSSFASGSEVDPVVAASVGVTTTAANCTLIYAAGADWATGPGSTTFSTPAGYTQLAALGDHGGPMWDWSAHQVAWATQAAAGPTGAVTGSFDGTQSGLGWTVLIAIAPP